MVIKCISIRNYFSILVNAAATSVVVEQQNQQTLSVPVGGIQTAGSFHSVSSLDSSAEMAKYFPDAQTPGLSSMR